MVNTGVKTCVDPFGRSVDVTIPLDGYNEFAGQSHTGREPDLFATIVARGQLVRTRGSWDKVLKTYTWDEVAVLFTWDDLYLLA